jgi:methylmalonyl-CoA/ethylmalonyl-CoA epimerase
VIKGFNHVGIAVKDLEKAIAHFKNVFGARVVWRKTYPDEKFETVIVTAGNLRFELLGSLDPGSLVSTFIESSGEGIHHLSIEVNDFNQVLADFRQKGLRVMAETDTKDFKAAFLHPKGNFGVLTEIIEPKGGWGN